MIANPLIGPGLVPVLSFALFFGPVAGWAIRWTAAGWGLQLVLLVVGALMVLPLAGLAEDATSLAVGLGLLIGSFELVLDALPGVILRLKQTLGHDLVRLPRRVTPGRPSHCTTSASPGRCSGASPS